jgi:hypothetical protein
VTRARPTATAGVVRVTMKFPRDADKRSCGQSGVRRAMCSDVTQDARETAGPPPFCDTVRTSRSHRSAGCRVRSGSAGEFVSLLSHDAP